MFDRRFLGVLVASFAFTSILSAQQIPVPTARMESAIDTVRIRAFIDVFAAAGRANPSVENGYGSTSVLAAHAARQDDLAVALIALLERENARMARASTDPLPGGFGEGYYADLFVTVARIRDPRAVRALMPVIANGNVVQTAVADLGNPAVPDLVRVVQSGESLNRFGAVCTLGMIAKRAVELRITPDNMELIRRGLLRGAHDTESFITRQEAVDALIVFADAEIGPVMERIAANDSYSRVVRGQAVYPIRESASVWLRAHSRDLLQRFESDDPFNRMSAWAQIRERAGMTAELGAQGVLLRVLETENDLITRTLRDPNEKFGVSQKYGEGYSEYYAELLNACDQYCDTSTDRVIAALAGAAHAPNSPFGWSLVTRFQGRILPVLLERMKEGSVIERGNVLEVFELLSDSSVVLSAGSRSLIHDAVVTATADTFPLVRLAAVELLGVVGRPADLPLLRRLAASDDIVDDGSGSGVRYPVREAAQAALARIIARGG